MTLPPSPCWVKTNVTHHPNNPVIPSGVHAGDNLVWLNGAWVSVPASTSRPCGSRKFYGHLVTGVISSANDLVSSGAALDSRMAYFNVVTNKLFVFDKGSNTWGEYVGCVGDMFVDISSGSSHQLTPATGTPPMIPAPVGGDTI